MLGVADDLHSQILVFRQDDRVTDKNNPPIIKYASFFIMIYFKCFGYPNAKLQYFFVVPKKND